MAPLNLRAILGSTPDLDSEFQQQWTNPGDIFSLLLLVGGDIVQKAMAQLVGVRIPLTKKQNGFSIPLTPVAFSFGWVAYAFASLTDIVGEGTLMPVTDVPSIVLNCSSGYVRTNRSWVLGRVLRDHEKKNEVDRAKVSLQIDIFEAEKNYRPDIDKYWLLSWGVILLQAIVAAIPWMLYGDWSKLFVTLCGTLGALVMGMIPQWRKEKWATRLLENGKKPRTKITALTRGNGYAHVMVFINRGFGYDVEAMASASGTEREAKTRYISILLAIWWTLLLITCSGLHDNTWYLIGVGGLGMLQNIYIAGISRSMGAFNFHYKPHSTIIGKPIEMDDRYEPDDSDAEDIENPLQRIGAVMGALMELERQIPGAGAGLVETFFPGSVGYEKGKFPFKRERKFWKYAFNTVKNRKKEWEKKQPEDSQDLKISM